MILVDTSGWVEFDRKTQSKVDRRLTELIADTDEVCTTEPIVMEVTAGAKTAPQELELRRLLDRFALLPFDPPTDFAAAGRIYRLCRSQGLTPRGLIDCMIISVAWRSGASLLCRDRDLVAIAKVLKVPVDPASS